MKRISRISRISNARVAKRKQQRQMSRKKRSGGAGLVKRYLTDPYKYVSEHASPWVTIVDSTRAASSLIRNVNQAYRFYIHCKDNVLQHLAEGDVKILFGGAVKELGDLLNSIFYSSFLSKHSAVLRGTVTSDESIKGDLRTFEENLKRYNLAAPNTSIASKIYKPINGAMILIWGDWYRYELNILMTNLLALIAEISVSGRARTALIPDIVGTNGIMIPGIAIPGTDSERKIKAQ